jgi:hypothetical protein
MLKERNRRDWIVESEDIVGGKVEFMKGEEKEEEEKEVINVTN